MPPTLPTGTETILLVEDDALVRSYATAQLGALGYKVVSAENARQAIEAIERGCAPDLLFTDMIMPGGMNGRELADQVLARRPGLKVLYTSGYAHGAMDGPPQDQHNGGPCGRTPAGEALSPTRSGDQGPRGARRARASSLNAAGAWDNVGSSIRRGESFVLCSSLGVTARKIGER